MERPLLLSLFFIQLCLYISADEHAMVYEDELLEPRYGKFFPLPNIPLPSRCANAGLCCRTLCAGANMGAACNADPNRPGVMFCLTAAGAATTGMPCRVTPTPPACPTCATFSCPGTTPAGQPTAMMCTMPPPNGMFVCL